MSARDGGPYRSIRKPADWVRRLPRTLQRIRENQALLAEAVARIELAGRVEDRTADGPRTTICQQADFATDWYADWAVRLGGVPVLHRGHWEHIMIARTLSTAGLVGAGARGVGFGVGREPLPAYFAAQGCSIVATDLAETDDRSETWAAGGQLASRVEDLLRPELCDAKTLRAAVELRRVDMTAIPADLNGFDFCWSACALEHLGTIDAGTRFVEQAMSCLRPGGLAVHTTEFNVSSDDETVESGHTVVLRRQDIERLAQRLEAAGHSVAPRLIDQGKGILDRIVDVPPYVGYPAVRIEVGGHVSTSLVLVVTRGGQ